MKLTLEEIWKMADLIEQINEKLPISHQNLEEETKKIKSSERILKLPKLQISENWGKGEDGSAPPERLELERIVKAATAGKTSVFDKLNIIQQQIDSLKKGTLGNIRNPSRILSQIMLLETLNRLFKSFQPSPAGFINEAFLSVFYGGYQTAAGKANAERDIGDISVDEGGTKIPVSLKTKAENALIVDGSVENLYTSINKAGKVYFDIFEKIQTESEDSHVGVLKFYRFTVDADNINQFLGVSAFEKDESGKLRPIAPFKRGGKEIREAKNPSVLEILDLLKAKKYSVAENELESMIENLGRNKMYELISILKNELSITDENPKLKKLSLNLEDLLSKLAKIRISQTTLGERPSFLEREFSRSQNEWSKFADLQKSPRISLKFSDKDIQLALEKAVEELDSSIVDIFNSLDGFSQSINSYLTSVSRARAKDGLKALEFAKKLEPQTAKIVKDE